jgi:hypothetical protein
MLPGSGPVSLYYVLSHQEEQRMKADGVSAENDCLSGGRQKNETQ